MARIGVQGLAASYSDAAVTLAYPNAERFYFDTFEDVFEALRSRTLDKAFLPFENSTAGFVTDNYRLLEDSDVQVTKEFIYKVTHCLLAPKGAKLSGIRGVYSHPQALMQCDRFLRQQGFQPVPWFDTAGAARDIAGEHSLEKAAIASELAASTYGLDILQKGINDLSENYTRFLALEHSDSLNNRPAKEANRLLLSCDREELAQITSKDGSIVNILSLPRKDEPWGHRIVLEVEGQNLEWANTFRATSVKILGHFHGTR